LGTQGDRTFGEKRDTKKGAKNPKALSFPKLLGYFEGGQRKRFRFFASLQVGEVNKSTSPTKNAVL